MIARLFAIAIISICTVAGIYIKTHHDDKRLKEIESACFNGSYIVNNMGEKYICTYMGKITYNDLRAD